MRISELSDCTKVPISTLKYYLREGLLMPGTPTAATRAVYDREHVDRVRLIRALIHAGGLSLASTRNVMAALEQDVDDNDVISHAHNALPCTLASTTELAQADQLLRSLKWRIGPANPGRAALGSALSTAAEGGLHISREELERYATAVTDIARVDLAAVFSSPDGPTTLYALIIRTVLMDPIIKALRLLAQEQVAHTTLTNE